MVADLLLKDELLKDGRRLQGCPLELIILLNQVVLQLLYEGVEGIVLAPVNVGVVLGRLNPIPLIILPRNPDNNRRDQGSHTIPKQNNIAIPIKDMQTICCIKKINFALRKIRLHRRLLKNSKFINCSLKEA